MKKAMVLLILLVTLVLSSCNTTASVQDNFTSDEIYSKFLSGRVAATDKSGKEKKITDFIGDQYNEYALYDMNGDSKNELLLKTNYGLTIFWINNNSITVWREDTNYCRPLNNKAILLERKGAAPEHIDYIYYVLGYNGDALYKLEFSAYLKNELENVEDSKYYINGNEVSQQIYDGMCNDLLNIGDNEIAWKAFDIVR